MVDWWNTNTLIMLNLAKFVGIMSDETTDITNHEQAIIMFRWINANFETHICICWQFDRFRLLCIVHYSLCCTADSFEGMHFYNYGAGILVNMSALLSVHM